MQKYLLIFLSFIATGCSAGEQVSNSQHQHPNTNGNSSQTASVDHNGMQHGPMDHSSMPSSPGAESAPFELQFLDTMIAHHQGAVDMATLADSRAERAEVKQLAGSIIYDQEREIGKMSEWRDGWFAEKPKAINMKFPGMSHGMTGMDLKKLQALSGKEFDLEFLRQMIPHHEGAIEMAKAVKNTDSKAELKELSDDIISAQESEIKQMREWLSTWSK